MGRKVRAEEVRSQSGLSLSPPLEPTKIKIRIEGKLKRKVRKKKNTTKLTNGGGRPGLG